MSYTANWFGVPFIKEIKQDSENNHKVKLRKVTELLDHDILPIKRGEKLTVEIMGVMVNAHKDTFKKTNDLYVGSSYIYRNGEPQVRKVHYLRAGVEAGKWQGDFDDNVIISKREFKDNDLKLIIKIYDVDEYFSGKFYTSLDEISRILFAFPSLLPYAAPTEITASLLPRVLRVVDKIERHDKILRQEIRFHVCEPNNWLPMLQPGNFVCFQQETDGTQFYLREDFHIVDEEGDEVKSLDYAVLRIDRKVVDNYTNIEVSQKMAKLASELHGKGESGRGPLDFLHETLDTYNRFKNFERYTQLKKQDRSGTLNSVEKQLMSELEALLKKDEVLGEFWR